MFSTARHKLHSTAMLASLTIARRYRGPRTSANGGYAAGLLAQVVGVPAVEVTLRLPPPLERPLAVTQDGERFLLLDGDALVAEARAGRSCGGGSCAADLRGGSRGVDGRRVLGRSGVRRVLRLRHPVRTGPGLEIHAGRVPGRVDDLVATTWVARDVRPEIAWAAIDCPGAYALRGEGRGEPLLARMTARIDRLPEEGERCVVVGWPLGEEGESVTRQPLSTVPTASRWRSLGSSGSSPGRMSQLTGFSPSPALRPPRAPVVERGVRATSSPPSSS